jgi:hypothetical protein
MAASAMPPAVIASQAQPARGGRDQSARAPARSVR